MTGAYHGGGAWKSGWEGKGSLALTKNWRTLMVAKMLCFKRERSEAKKRCQMVSDAGKGQTASHGSESDLISKAVEIIEGF